MTPEGTFRDAIALLVKQYGQLTTTGVKDLIEDVLQLDAEDLVQSKTRNEPMYKQRIGNIISHQKEQVHYYNGYVVDKSKSPAVWSDIVGSQTNGDARPLEASEASVRRRRRKNFKPRHIDWNELMETRGVLGSAGEEFVYKEELSKVSNDPNLGALDASRVMHLSVVQGDGAGYDVISVDENGNTINIEVKTTAGPMTNAFYMSVNEYEYMKQNEDATDVFLYRVYNFDLRTQTGEIAVITPRELFTDFNFDPTNFKVTHK
ncbi:DUF3883 domain-containing protein [Limosilactobacillus fermentum]|uniref:DUF3883 domain-containing protein n=1 Tax=Limosilactobacillus fermentum TaxID=1613 RepID=UPI003891C992